MNIKEKLPSYNGHHTFTNDERTWKKMSNKNKTQIPLILISIFIMCAIGMLCLVCYSFITGKIHLKSETHTTDAKTANVKKVIASENALMYKLDNGEKLYDDGEKKQDVFGAIKLSHNVIENKTQTTIQPGDKITYKIKHVKHNDQIFTSDESLPENGNVYIITDVVSQ